MGISRIFLYMAFRWRADNDPTLNAGLVSSFVIFQGIQTSIAKEPCSFVIFPGGCLDILPSPPPPLGPRMYHMQFVESNTTENQIQITRLDGDV